MNKIVMECKLRQEIRNCRKQIQEARVKCLNNKISFYIYDDVKRTLNKQIREAEEKIATLCTM